MACPYPSGPSRAFKPLPEERIDEFVLNFTLHHHHALLAKFIDCIKDKIRSVRYCRHKSGIKQNTASRAINIERPLTLFYAIGGWKYSRVASLGSQQPQTATRKPNGPETGTPFTGFPGTQGPCKGTHVKWLLGASSRLAQDCTAAAQGCLLMAQVKTASAQTRDWKWNLVRSRLVYEFCGIDVSD
jgi:hypothetical protein